MGNDVQTRVTRQPLTGKSPFQGAAIKPDAPVIEPAEKNDVGRTEQPLVLARPDLKAAPERAESPEEEAAEAKAAGLKAAQKQAEIRKRLGNDVVVEMLGGDVPGALAMLANSAYMPNALKPVTTLFNLFNAATGMVGAANDADMAYGTMRNPAATKMDKAVDLGHLIFGTVTSTVSDFIPVFDTAMNQHPVSALLFNGGQVLGMVMDTLHTVYDYKRGGAQSHIDGDEKAQAKYAILDNAEKSASKILQGMGSLGANAQAWGWTLGMPAELLKTMTTLGGSVGFVMGAKQVQKAMDLRTSLEALKADGHTTIRFPVVTKNGPDLKEISMDEAMQRADSMQKWGRAQEATSALTTVAGITGLHLIAMGAVAGGIGLALVGGSVIAYKLLPKPLQAQVDKVIKPIAHAAHEVAEFARPVTEPIDHAINKTIELGTRGLTYVGHKLGQAASWTAKELKPVTDPIVRVMAPPINKAEHVMYVGAEHLVDGTIAAAHGVSVASKAVGHFTEEYLPPVAHAATYLGHQVANGARAVSSYTNKALGNDVETASPNSTAPAALPQGE